MKSQITLDGKEVRAIIAKALGIPQEKVIQLRYGFGIEGYTAEQVELMLKNAGIE